MDIIGLRFVRYCFIVGFCVVCSVPADGGGRRDTSVLHREWSFSFDGGGGSSGFLRNGSLTGIFVGRRDSLMLTARSTNDGGDVTEDIGLQTDWHHEFERSLLGEVSLDLNGIDRRRYVRNESHLLSGTYGHHDEDSRLEFSGVVLYDRENGRRRARTDLKGIYGDAYIEEVSEGSNEHIEVDGELSYQVSRDNYVLRNNLEVYGDFDHGWGSTVRNGQTIRQDVKPYQYYFRDQFHIEKELRRGRWSFDALAGYNLLPGRLLVHGLYSQKTDQGCVDGQVDVSYQKTTGTWRWSMTAGTDISQRSYDVSLFGYGCRDDYMEIRPHIVPAMTVGTEKGYLSLSVPVSMMVRVFNDTHDLQAYINPELGFHKQAGQFAVDLSGYWRWRPSDFYSLTSQQLYVDYMTMLSGNGQLDWSRQDGQEVSFSWTDRKHRASVRLAGMRKHTTHERLFSNTLQTDGIYWRHLSDHYGRRTLWRTELLITKTLGFWQGRVEGYGIMSWQDYQLFAGGETQDCHRYVRFASLGCQVHPVKWMELSFGGQYDYSQYRFVFEGSGMNIRSLQASGHLRLTPGCWTFQADGSLLFQDCSERREDWFVDCSASCRLGPVTLGVSCRNLLDVRDFTRITVGDDYSLVTSGELRGREILGSVVIRF